MEKQEAINMMQAIVDHLKTTTDRKVDIQLDSSRGIRTVFVDDFPVNYPDSEVFYSIQLSFRVPTKNPVTQEMEI